MAHEKVFYIRETLRRVSPGDTVTVCGNYMEAALREQTDMRVVLARHESAMSYGVASCCQVLGAPE